jgi:hypothetical protein
MKHTIVWGCLALASSVNALASVEGEMPGAGRRADSAPLFAAKSFDSTVRADYLVVLKQGKSKSVSNTLPFAHLPKSVDARVLSVASEALGVGGFIHAMSSSHFLASLDQRALTWLRNHPDVEFIDSNTAAFAKSKRPVAGLEFVGAQKGLTSTRVVINGGILGYNVSGYIQPTIQSGTMFVDAAELLRFCDYSVPSNGAQLKAQAGTHAAGPFSVTINSGASSMTVATQSGQSVSVALGGTAFSQSGKLMVPARPLLERACMSRIIDWDQDTLSLQTYYLNKLDTGIYFYGVQQNAITSDQPGSQKYIPGQPNPFFDPSKPTIIYAHGWNKGSVTAGNREGLLLTTGGVWQNVQNYWLTRNWNVGIFQWNQLADDDFGLQPVDTEKKIYDANSRNIGMRWKKNDGSFSSRGNPTVTVTQLYRSAYLQVASALASGLEIRLVGNSLGGNLTVAMTRELAINGSRLPLRVTLQDPYWDSSLDSSDGVTPPGGFANNRAVGIDGARRISTAGIALEYFRSSLAGQTGYVRDIAMVASYTNLKPLYTNDIGAKHTQPTRVYFWAVENGGTTATPNTPFQTVRARMNTNNYWNQADAGANTTTPSDDAYTTVSGKPN